MLSNSTEHTVVIYKCVTTSCLFSQFFFFSLKTTLISSKQGTTTGRHTFVNSYFQKAVLLGYIKIMKSQLIGFLMNFWISSSIALYFHSGEREEKCIIEDVPSDTLVTGNYKVQKWDIHKQDFLDSAPGLGMFVTVTTPSAERIHLDIRVGEHFVDEAVVRAKDKVNEVNFRLEHLIEQIHHVSKEQNYEREREEKFRNISEQTNSNILWWAVAQTLILISIGIWQIKSLRDFFIAKKLV
ncbi:transmembrane emp24 domain-containing protein 11-like isoform X2 [Oxyura jamaicensis]|uniref:transmembrane emp24 domain-containing protein 11-like isoform X2 n=1 Tax=Oxyura jamaicensis TaxID=8884 RepID=UPI0015A543B6|nr:transmembrane emp24 domain-containing protein 11-like isoform X2 [Oxyura jamaicensis]